MSLLFILLLSSFSCVENLSQFGSLLISKDEVFAYSESSFAFVNIRPYLPYHILVSPKRVVERYKDMTPDEVIDIHLFIQRLLICLDGLGTSWNVNLQDGKDAGQSISHVHFHLLPRHANDLSNVENGYSKLEKIVDLDRRGLAEIITRNKDEMKEEALYLRNYLKTQGFVGYE